MKDNYNDGRDSNGYKRQQFVENIDNIINLIDKGIMEIQDLTNAEKEEIINFYKEKITMNNKELLEIKQKIEMYSNQYLEK